MIVAQGLSDCAADSGQLVPMIDAVIANTGTKPAQMSADSGYCSEVNIQAMEDRQIEAFIATGRQKHGEAAGDGGKAQGARVELTLPPVSIQF
ncbi:MAG: hypothetical protein EOS85_35525 [Mesorhizobium sp.]|nr:MAG: hypothetical protein EOS85_35525 [Mesorhizobium sp.]